MVGMSMARNTRSGTLVGPGIWRKCLPVCTVISAVLPVAPWLYRLEYHYLAGLSPARRAPSMLIATPLPCNGETRMQNMRPSHEIEPMAAMRAGKSGNSAENGALAARLTREITGDVFFDRFNRGRYATDASFYQILPQGVVVPRTMEEALRALSIARDEGLVVTPRGGGTSQCGQTVNEGIVVDFSKHLNRLLSLDVENRTCVVEPGIVLDDLNRQLKKHGLWFPVDVSTASRATIGGMAGNNSCGGRSLRYGTMRDNTLSMHAALADGTTLQFGEVPRDRNGKPSGVLLAWPRRLALFAKGLESLLGIFRHRQ